MRDWDEKPTNWKFSFHKFIRNAEFVIAECRRLAITLLEFGSLLYVLYKVARHL